MADRRPTACRYYDPPGLWCQWCARGRPDKCLDPRMLGPGFHSPDDGLPAAEQPDRGPLTDLSRPLLQALGFVALGVAIATLAYGHLAGLAALLVAVALLAIATLS